MGQTELHAIFQADRAAKAAARRFVDFLMAELTGDPNPQENVVPRRRGVIGQQIADGNNQYSAGNARRWECGIEPKYVGMSMLSTQ
jgi:hypothetical protein